MGGRRRSVAGGPANFACEGPTRVLSCNYACMEFMLLNALRLRRKGVTLFCNFGGSPGSVLKGQLAAEGLLKAAPDGGP